MNNDKIYDFAIVGGGLVGLASAWALRAKHTTAAIALIEKESDVALHQSGRNSGVLHSGVYYKRGSLKADLVARGRDRILDFCKQQGIRYELCGKLVIATKEDEFAQLDELYQRGIENGLTVRNMDGNDIKEIEPHAAGRRAIWVPEAGIINSKVLLRHCSDY